MLQQTRVEAMLPRYRAFLARFPDPAALAAADEDEALAAWSGLGYYRRARALHRAARRLAEAGGEVPRSSAELRKLPGVGAYTAAAVASIAFGEPVAVVDGNVRRVLARIFAVEGVAGRAGFERRIRELADALMATGGARDPGHWNQALMELGALVCIPGRPRCEACPVESLCAARSQGREREFPEPAPKPATVTVRATRGVLRDGEGRLLVVRRQTPPLKGLYDFPGGPCDPGEAPRDALLRAVRERFRLELAVGRSLPPFRHQVMNRRITVFAFEARVAGTPAGLPEEARWVRPEDMATLPAGAIPAKVLARLEPADGKADGTTDGSTGEGRSNGSSAYTARPSS